MKGRGNARAQIPLELASLIRGLQARERAKVKALFEAALTAASERRIADIWDEPELAASWWVLLVSGTDDAEERQMLEIILRWKALTIKHSASLVCVQESDRDLYRLCLSQFKVARCPTMLLGSSRDMSNCISFGADLLRILISRKGALHRFLMSMHTTLERSGDLSAVRRQLVDHKFWSTLQIPAGDVKKALSDLARAQDAFDVFFSHNSKDKSAVIRLAKTLQARGIRVWLDSWELLPGRPWQDALERIIKETRTAAVLVGKEGFGPWEVPEMRSCISQFVERDMPVIPVLLPGVRSVPDLPVFLRQFTWVDLRRGMTKQGLDRLEHGIKDATNK